MQLTKKQKIMLGVLAVALAGLAVDRFMLAPPTSAEASEGQAEPVTTAPATTSDGPSTAEPVDVNRSRQASQASELPDYTGLSDRLADLTKASQAADGTFNLFAEPEHWAEPVVESQPEIISEPDGPITSSRIFLETHKLTSLIETKQGTIAVINGKQYTEGLTLETFVLRGFIEKSSFGRAALWESLRNGEMVVMPVSH